MLFFYYSNFLLLLYFLVPETGHQSLTVWLFSTCFSLWVIFLLQHCSSRGGDSFAWISTAPHSSFHSSTSQWVKWISCTQFSRKENNRLLSILLFIKRSSSSAAALQFSILVQFIHSTVLHTLTYTIALSHYISTRLLYWFRTHYNSHSSHLYTLINTCTYLYW